MISVMSTKKVLEKALSAIHGIFRDEGFCADVVLSKPDKERYATEVGGFFVGKNARDVHCMYNGKFGSGEEVKSVIVVDESHRDKASFLEIRDK